MAKRTTIPERSKGGRIERAAQRARFTLMAKAHADGSIEQGVYLKELAWNLKRSKRYGDKVGGL